MPNKIFSKPHRFNSFCFYYKLTFFKNKKNIYEYIHISLKILIFTLIIIVY